jgi:hypothetical protein
MTALTEKAMLVRHIVRKKDFRKFDQQVSEEIAKQHGSDPSKSGRYNKVLINREFLDQINKICSRAYNHHIEHTLPWDDWGSRVLPAKMYFEYMAKQGQYRDELQAAVDEFLTHYDEMKEEAKKRLNGMYRETDYPTKESLGDTFGIDVNVTPIPTGDDFRVSLGDQEVEMIRADIEERMQAVIDETVKELWRRLYESIETMRDRLGSYMNDSSKRFQSSWIENVRRIVEILPKLNFTDNQELKQIAISIEDELLNYSKHELQSDPLALMETEKAADSILKEMAAYIGA